MIEYIFIVPYRDREHHLVHFMKYMEYLLEDYDKDTYEILIVHQKDKRPFNRGAIKNIGFLYAKEKYNHYQDINFIFNDIDTLPCIKNTFNYKTEKGIVKHFYGFEYCLGGIFSIKGCDFELINGFPNYWTWGFEDNVIYYRCNDKNLSIDRTEFVKFGDMKVIQCIDSLTKATEKKRRTIEHLKRDINGLNNITNYNFKYNDTMLDVETFDCDLEIPKKVEFLSLTQQNSIKKNNFNMKFL